MGFVFADDAVLIEPRRAPVAPKKQEEAVMSGERGCDACPLQLTWPRLGSPQMAMSGLPEADLLALGEAPGEVEDERGEPFVGPSGKMLRQHIPHRLMDRMAYSNATRCRPPGNRTPTGHEMHCCSTYLEDDIAAGSFKAILGLGGTALMRFFNEASITHMVGVRVPVEVGAKNLWLFPNFHPAFLLHNGGDRAREYPVFAAAMKNFFASVDKWKPPVIEKPKPADVICVYNEEDATNLYHRLEGPVGIDIETQKLKPYMRNSRLLSGALSDGKLTFAFPVSHPDAPNDWGAALLLHAAADRQWVAHNANFELVWLLWTARELGYDDWRPHSFDDSMALGRLYHSRNTLLDLGTMSRIILGTNVKKLTNVNAKYVESYTLDEILPYNGLDAWASVRIDARLHNHRAILQDEYTRLIGAIESTAHMELLGLHADREVAAALKDTWGTIAAEKRQEARTIYEVRTFERERQQEFNIGNPDHVGIALADYGRVELPRNKKSYSTGDELIRPLADRGNPLAECTLGYREAIKHVSNYIEPVLKLDEMHIDGLLHPSYTTMHVATFRTSANDTNIQNWPKRRHREFRRQVVAPPGHILLSCDEGQIQGRIYGMASRDPVLCQSFIDKEDIHSHWLGKLIDIYPEYLDRLRHKLNLDTASEAVLRKKGRDLIKTDFVFASFFGTTADNCAERTSIPLAVISELLNDFWTRFHVAKKWLNERRAEYRDTGGVKTLNGQLRFGVMTGNEPIIQPIQNGEAVIVLDCQNELQKLSIEHNDPYFMPRINVHDDLTFILPDNETRVEEYRAEIERIMTKVRYRWQIVPLIVEASVGYNWCDMEDIGTFEGDYVRGNVVPFRPPPERERNPAELVWRFEERTDRHGKPLWLHQSRHVRCMIVQSGSTTGNRSYTSSTYSLSDPAYYQPGGSLFGTSDRYPRKEDHRSIREAIAFAESIKTLPELYRATVPGPKNRDNGPAEWRERATPFRETGR
jgi:uracil-DNA glycosylase family 4